MEQLIFRLQIDKTFTYDVNVARAATEEACVKAIVSHLCLESYNNINKFILYTVVDEIEIETLSTIVFSVLPNTNTPPPVEDAIEKAMEIVNKDLYDIGMEWVWENGAHRKIIYRAKTKKNEDAEIVLVKEEYKKAREAHDIVMKEWCEMNAKLAKSKEVLEEADKKLESITKRLKST